MLIPDDIAERSSRAINEGRELQLASEELRRLADEVARANELLREWIAKYDPSLRRIDTSGRQS